MEKFQVGMKGLIYWPLNKMQVLLPKGSGFGELQMGEKNTSIQRKGWQQGKSCNIHCQGLPLWVGAMPKSKWWTSRPEILKGSPSSYVNCALMYLQQREAPTLSRSPSVTVQPVFLLLGRALPALYQGSAWAANWLAKSHCTSMVVNKSAEEGVLSLGWITVLCCIHVFYGRRT